MGLHAEEVNGLGRVEPPKRRHYVLAQSFYPHDQSIETMPLARSWAEELVAEYFLLKGRAILIDVGIGAGKGGGRRDIDVIAVRPATGDILLIDVRCMSKKPEAVCEESLNLLRQAEKVVKREYKCTSVKKLVILIGGGPSDRQRVNEIKDEMRRKNAKVEILTLVELIDEIVKYIEEWRKEQKGKLVRESTQPALPDRLYLLKMLEFLRDCGLIKGCGKP